MENLSGQDNIKIENKEVELKTDIISSQDLIDRIYQGDSTPRDKRFVSFKEGGVFRYFDVGDLVYKISKSNRLYPVVELNNLIVGYIGIRARSR